MRLWLLILLCVHAVHLTAQQQMQNQTFGKFENPKNSIWEMGDLRLSAPLETSALLLLEAYKKTASGNLGNSCRFSPECSRFMAESIRFNGIWTGLLLGCDRLLRCNHEAELEHSEHLRDNKTGKIYDSAVEY